MGSAWFWRVTRVADLLLRLRGLGSGRQVPRPLHLLQRDHLCGVQVTCRLLQEEGGSVVVRLCGEPARQTRQKHSDPYEVLKDRSHDVEPGEGSAGVSMVVEDGTALVRQGAQRRQGRKGGEPYSLFVGPRVVPELRGEVRPVHVVLSFRLGCSRERMEKRERERERERERRMVSGLACRGSLGLKSSEARSSPCGARVWSSAPQGRRLFAPASHLATVPPDPEVPLRSWPPRRPRGRAPAVLSPPKASF